MENAPITAKLTALGAKVAQLSRGRLLVATAGTSTVFREDGTKDPVQPVRSPDPEPPAGVEP